MELIELKKQRIKTYRELVNLLCLIPSEYKNTRSKIKELMNFIDSKEFMKG